MGSIKQIKPSLFMGIDVGTQGVRVLIVTEKGQSVAGSAVSFTQLNTSDLPGYSSQSPDMWWDATATAIQQAISKLKDQNLNSADIKALAVDATSGTILPVDKDGTALCHGIMYNDSRSQLETHLVRELGGDHEHKMGLRFNASFALPKILWLQKNRPDIYDRSQFIIHQADYIVGKLSGDFSVSDFSNGLKTGYDAIDRCWPVFISALGLDIKKLPRIVAPGQVIGTASTPAALDLGLSPQTLITAGATDGYCSGLAAGAVQRGNWASILGTTLVLKGVSGKLIIDPTGSSYCHLLPSGNWLTGGASNVGGLCLNQHFNKSQFAQLDITALTIAPSGVLIYPLTGTGERYPFVDPDVTEFVVGDISQPQVHYTALMEGVGYVERLAYTQSQRMGCIVGDSIFTTGGATRSDAWLTIRANILGKTLQVPAVVDATMGSALLAASQTAYKNLEEAASNMITIVKKVEPDLAVSQKYDTLYEEFEAECCKRFKQLTIERSYQ